MRRRKTPTSANKIIHVYDAQLRAPARLWSCFAALSRSGIAASATAIAAVCLCLTTVCIPGCQCQPPARSCVDPTALLQLILNPDSRSKLIEAKNICLHTCFCCQKEVLYKSYNPSHSSNHASLLEKCDRGDPALHCYRTAVCRQTEKSVLCRPQRSILGQSQNNCPDENTQIDTLRRDQLPHTSPLFFFLFFF